MNNNFERAHSQWLDPPEDEKICDDGCGETLVRDADGDWVCSNKFCPSKFSEGSTEREMAEMLVGATETVRSLAAKLRLRRQA